MGIYLKKYYDKLPNTTTIVILYVYKYIFKKLQFIFVLC